MELSTLQCEKASAPIAKTNSVSKHNIFLLVFFFANMYLRELDLSLHQGREGFIQQSCIELRGFHTKQAPLSSFSNR